MSLEPHSAASPVEPTQTEPTAFEPTPMSTPAEPIAMTTPTEPITTPAEPIAMTTPAAPAGFDINELFNVPLKRWSVFGIISGLLVMMGSLGPWVTLGGFSAAGTDGDGKITLFLALLAVAGLGFFLTAQGSRLTWLPWVTGGLGAVIALIAFIDIIDLDSGEETIFGSVSPGWGIILVLLAGLALTAMSTLAALAARKSKTA